MQNIFLVILQKQPDVFCEHELISMDDICFHRRYKWFEFSRRLRRYSQHLAIFRKYDFLVISWHRRRKQQLVYCTYRYQNMLLNSNECGFFTARLRFFFQINDYSMEISYIWRQLFHPHMVAL